MPRGKGTKPRTVDKRFRPGFIADLDGRYPVVRGLKHRLGCYLSDLGGMENLSTMEQTVVKRIVHLEHLVEQRESALIAGAGTNINEYLASINTLSGLLSKIGLRRRAKTLSLKDYLSSSKPEPVPAPSPAPSGPQTFHREDLNGNECHNDHQRAERRIGPTSEERPHGHAERKE